MTDMANPYDDIELDATGMRVLAHPVRLALLERLQLGGPATATLLAPQVGATPSVASWHLRHLAKHGLVRDASEARGSGRERWWEAASRGFRFTGGGEAARALTRVMETVEGDLVGRWRAEVEPTLEPEWLEVAGRSNTRILVTAAELVDLEAAIEALLAPFVRRKADGAAVPATARGVRLLRHTMPEGST
ncbi:MAG: helix-turn-helix domain-containing protein [Lapillicoccus sp.]